MSKFVHALNIEKFANMLFSEAPPRERATLIKLLIEEEDRFGKGIEQLAQADARISKGYILVENQRALIARLSESGKDTTEAEKLLLRLMQVLSLFVLYRLQILDQLDRDALLVS